MNGDIDIFKNGGKLQITRSMQQMQTLRTRLKISGDLSDFPNFNKSKDLEYIKDQMSRNLAKEIFDRVQLKQRFDPFENSTIFSMDVNIPENELIIENVNNKNGLLNLLNSIMSEDISFSKKIRIEDAIRRIENNEIFIG